MHFTLITQKIINSIFDGRIFISQTEINDANINRSPSAYANNPAEEKAQYKDNTDKTLVQLRFMDKNNREVMGAFNWFAGELKIDLDLLNFESSFSRMKFTRHR